MNDPSRKSELIEEALAILRETVQQFPDDPVSRNSLAEILRDVGRLDEAEALYRESASRFPGDVVARSGLAESLKELNRVREAVQILRETVRQFPGDLVAALSLADSLARMGEFQESIGLYRELVNRFPGNPVARNGLAWTLRQAALMPRDYGGANGPARYKYQVALSFAGEDRPMASEVARLLQSRGVSVFYDEYEQADLWGKDLYQHLANIYSEEAQYCVVFISRHYAAKLWTKHELKQAQARAFRENQEYILPVRLDDTELPGLPETVGYLDLRVHSTAVLVSAVLKKLGQDSPDADPNRSGAVPSRNSADQVVDKWVSLDYIERSGITKRLRDEGFDSRLVRAIDESTCIDLEGWEYALIEEKGGGLARLKIHDVPAIGSYHILLKRRQVAAQQGA